VPDADPLHVEVWSDIVCPWCFIGKRRMDRAVDAIRRDASCAAEIEIVYRPFQLDPGAPAGVAEPVAETYARKFGGADRAAEMMTRVTAVAAAEGLEFRLDRAQRANTADAHRLLGWTLANADAATQAELKESLMQAYFTEGEDIGDHDVLVDRAEQCALDRVAVRSMLGSDAGIEALAVELQRASDTDIAAVPTYVFAGRWAVPGAQEASVFEQVFRRLANRPAEPVDGDMVRE